MASDKQFADDLRGGFIEQPDPLWDLPADAPQWSTVRSNLVMRLRISALNHFIAMDRTKTAKKLKAEIEREMARQ